MAVDMNKLAALTGYTPGSAGFTMGKIKRKLKNKTAGISEDSPAAKSARGRPRTATTSTPKKRGATAAPTSASKRRARQPTSSPSHSDANDDDDDDFGLGGPKVKKEEPAFDDGFDLVEEDVSARDARGVSYGFLDGMETFSGAAKGSGRNASNGYRAVQLEEEGE
ncbi:hypothetical protein J4E93_001272 [Alternaria ventricosa]|uniref:uncharacterized protein n=1 Tax=Alternaria ventricosa TaxID=1187951 RepID=UPI0020C1CAE2|nr:uncharacterized protein J4E93_001272 [Alternaria ventricosa]KAI4653506.1 hypothetical protein J4E93_001272 [Alternaria ventricosa]